jgi:hypothetical protein
MKHPKAREEMGTTPNGPHVTDSHQPRQPTTYSELSKHPNAIDVPPDIEVPRLPPNSPWASDPVPPEPPLGYAIDEVGPDSGDGASPKRREN